MIPKYMFLQIWLYVISLAVSIQCQDKISNEKKDAFQLHKVVELPAVLKECSGMVVLKKNVFVGINDGGDKPNLYLFTGDKNEPARAIQVSGVQNNDWEELASDEDHIYIGDTGNNRGIRQDLMVYRVSKKDVMLKDKVTPEKFMIRYENQAQFDKSKEGNYDCEAMVIMHDSIFLFTKNRGNQRTDLYGFPDIPGYYRLKNIGSFDAKGLITGADYVYNKISGGELILVGYKTHNHEYEPFLIHFSDFEGSGFFKGRSQRITLEEKLQTESVSFVEDHKVYLTNEEEKGKEGYVFEMVLP
jgi:hypothetical protein